MVPLNPKSSPSSTNKLSAAVIDLTSAPERCDVIDVPSLPLSTVRTFPVISVTYTSSPSISKYVFLTIDAALPTAIKVSYVVISFDKVVNTVPV